MLLHTHTHTFTHGCFYTQTLLHTDSFTHRPFLHTDTFTHKRFYTQRLLHTDAYTETFTHRRFYTHIHIHTFLLHTHTLSHTEAFIHRSLHIAPQRRALFRKSTSEPPKVVRPCGVLYILTSKCASRHNGVHFFESRYLSLQKWTEYGVLCTFSLGNVLRATTACTFSTSQLPKVVRPCGVLCILTWTCASRRNGVHFFDIATSKSGPTLVCFVHFDLDMCFAPQRRALFRHRNFQKWSDIGVFCTF